MTFRNSLALGVVAAFVVVLVAAGLLLPMMVGGWEAGTVTGECDDWAETSLTPIGNCDFAPIWRGFRYSNDYESFDWSEDGGDAEDSELQVWNIVGTVAITDDASIDGTLSLESIGASGMTTASISRENAASSIEWVEFWYWKDNLCRFLYYAGSDGDMINWYHKEDGKIYIVYEGGTDSYAFGHEDEWVHVEMEIYWETPDYILRLNGEAIEQNAGMREQTWHDDKASFRAGEADRVYVDDINFCEREQETGDFQEGNFSILLDGLQGDEVYKVRAYATTDLISYGQSDWFRCKTTGYQEFPVWLVVMLVVIVGLGLYTGGWILSVVGIIICVVSYGWVSMAETSEITVWGASALFLIVIGFIVLSMIFREVRKGA